MSHACLFRKLDNTCPAKTTILAGAVHETEQSLGSRQDGRGAVDVVPRGGHADRVAAGFAGTPTHQTIDALGVPVGSFLGGLGSWRLSLWFVEVVSFVALIGILAWMPAVESNLAIPCRRLIDG